MARSRPRQDKAVARAIRAGCNCNRQRRSRRRRRRRRRRRWVSGDLPISRPHPPIYMTDTLRWHALINGICLYLTVPPSRSLCLFCFVCREHRKALVSERDRRGSLLIASAYQFAMSNCTCDHYVTARLAIRFAGSHVTSLPLALGIRGTGGQIYFRYVTEPRAGSTSSIANFEQCSSNCRTIPSSFCSRLVSLVSASGPILPPANSLSLSLSLFLSLS